MIATNKQNILNKSIIIILYLLTYTLFLDNIFAAPTAPICTDVYNLIGIKHLQFSAAITDLKTQSNNATLSEVNINRSAQQLLNSATQLETQLNSEIKTIEKDLSELNQKYLHNNLSSINKNKVLEQMDLLFKRQGYFIRQVLKIETQIRTIKLLNNSRRFSQNHSLQDVISEDLTNIFETTPPENIFNEIKAFLIAKPFINISELTLILKLLPATTTNKFKVGNYTILQLLNIRFGTKWLLTKGTDNLGLILLAIQKTKQLDEKNHQHNYRGDLEDLFNHLFRLIRPHIDLTTGATLSGNESMAEAQNALMHGQLKSLFTSLLEEKLISDI